MYWFLPDGSAGSRRTSLITSDKSSKPNPKLPYCRPHPAVDRSATESGDSVRLETQAANGPLRAADVVYLQATFSLGNLKPLD